MALFSSPYREYEVVMKGERVEYVKTPRGDVMEKIIETPKAIKFNNYLYSTEDPEEIDFLRKDPLIKEITSENPNDGIVLERNKWMTYKEVIDMGVSVHTLNRWVNQNLVEVKTIDGKKYYNSNHISNLMEENK